ncbi:hypothetical protein XENTR_v10002478 [Xenopus tropicalis]|nr:hypothetical protein XENTR_v10002478 [Xenopus tropicalis]
MHDSNCKLNLFLSCIFEWIYGSQSHAENFHDLLLSFIGYLGETLAHSNSTFLFRNISCMKQVRGICDDCRCKW